MTNGLVIYTAISNHYDFLRDTPTSLAGLEFVCFSDCHPAGELHGWRVRPFPNDIDDSTRRCRDVKINPHRYFPDKTYSLWVDSNVQIRDAAAPLLIELLAADIGFSSFSHQSRSCAYEEAIACKRKNKDDHKLIDSQVAYLRSQDFPEQAGLFETNVIFRAHNNPRVVAAMEIWDGLLKKFSKRDQLGINFAIWKSGLEASSIMGSARGNNPAFLRGKHRNPEGRNIRAYIEAYAYMNPVYELLRGLINRRR